MIIFLWVVFSILVGALANSKGRSFFGYFCLSLLFSPIVGFITVAIVPDIKHDNNKDSTT